MHSLTCLTSSTYCSVMLYGNMSYFVYPCTMLMDIRTVSTLGLFILCGQKCLCLISPCFYFFFWPVCLAAASSAEWEWSEQRCHLLPFPVFGGKHSAFHLWVWWKLWGFCIFIYGGAGLCGGSGSSLAVVRGPLCGGFSLQVTGCGVRWLSNCGTWT